MLIISIDDCFCDLTKMVYKKVERKLNELR